MVHNSERYRFARDKAVVSGQSGKASKTASAITLTAIHSLLWAALLILWVFVVPGFVQMFDEFAVELPMMTQFMIRLSDMLARYWYLFVVLGIAGIVLDFVTLLVLGKLGRSVQVVFGIAMAIVPLLLGGLTVISFVLPLMQLVSDLS
jgi:type II secretory pathway component PulF